MDKRITFPTKAHKVTFLKIKCKTDHLQKESRADCNWKIGSSLKRRHFKINFDVMSKHQDFRCGKIIMNTVSEGNE